MTKNLMKRMMAVAMVATALVTSSSIVSAAEVGADAKDMVKVIVDGDVKYFSTNGVSTVGDLLASNNIVVTKSTAVSVDLDKTVKNNDEIVIAQPKTVTVSVDGGKVVSATTSASNLGAFLDEYESENGGTYYLSTQTSSTPLTEGMYVQLATIKEVSVDTYEAIPYETKEVKTDSLYVGEKKVVTAGVEGVKTTTTTTKYVGDKVDTTESNTVVTKEPVTEVINVGTKVKQNVIPGLDVTYKSVSTFDATAYCPCSLCCGKYANGYCANGMKATYGVCAVDTRVIPLGTKLYVEGYGYCIAADTGGAIKGNRIDLCYGTHSAALASGFGHKAVKVYVIG